MTMLSISIWNHLKRKYLRRRRSRSPLSLACALLLPAALVVGSAGAEAAVRSGPDFPQEGISSFLEGSASAAVTMKRVYLCGEEIRPLGVMDPPSVLKLLGSHPGWEAGFDEKGGVVVTERIDDLSEACKQSATFGVDDGGSLTLFEGPPSDEKVMKTFFQLDLQYMESTLPKQERDKLLSGIRVQDRDEFNSVLSTYNDFALEGSRGATKRAY